MADPAALDASIVVKPQLDVRVRNTRGVLLVATSRQTLELSETGAFIWRLVDGELSVGAIAERLAAEYEVDLETATTDTGELLAELAQKGFVSA